MGYIFDAMNLVASGGAAPRRERKKRRPAIPDTEPTPQPESPSQETQGPDVVHTLGLADQTQGAEASTAPPAPLAFTAQAQMADEPAAPAPGAGNWTFTDVDMTGIDDRLVVLTKPSSLMSEEYRSIRTSMLARWEHKRHLVHTITSATPQEGKTITSLNLGLSFAELRNRKTIVLECDLRLPQFSTLLALKDHPGMISVLQDRAKLKDVILNVGQTNLHMIVAGGRANDHAVQLLHSARLVALLQQLRQKYDHVIVDTPPVVELADAGIIGSMSDDVQMIVRMGLTPRPLVDQAIRTLASYNAPVTGLIATDQTRNRGRYYYKYGYRYRYRYASKQAA